jgi:ABC-type transporter Mla subunit MlaD
MLNQLSEQVKKSSQPASELFAANVKAIQSVTQQQAALVSGVIGDSMELFKALSGQADSKGLLAAQSAYAESIRDRVTTTTKSTYGALNIVGQQFADTMKNSFDMSQAVSVAKAVASPKAIAAPEKKVVAKKVAAKKASVKRAAPTKLESTEKPATVKAEVKPAAAPAPARKPVVKTTAKKAQPIKKVAKPVPTLSADNVRAVPKKAEEKTVTENTGVTNAS